MSYIDKIKVDGSLYSVQDDRLPSPDAQDEGKVIAVDASGNYELNAPIDAYTKTETDAKLALKADASSVYTKSQVDTALGNKQDTLTAGSNISIDDNVISATDTTYTAGTNISIDNGVISAVDTTYTAGTNIDISNGVISVVGELGVDDYDDLDNKPIINQDLDAVGFTPVANTYYRHTSEGSGLEVFTIGQILSNGDKIHFDTSKESELVTYLEGLEYSDGEYAMLARNNNIPIIGVFDLATLAGIQGYCLFFDSPSSPGEIDIIYSTTAFDFEGITAVAGFQNLDGNGDYTVKTTRNPVTAINDTNPPTWNGIIIGTAAASHASQYVSGKIYFYDGEEYKAIDGSGSGGSSDYFELDNIPIKKAPKPQLSNITAGQVISTINIDTTKSVDWSYCTFNNLVYGKQTIELEEINYVTTEPQDPTENLFWKDGNTFKYYDEDASSWVTFAPATISATKYMITSESETEAGYLQSDYEYAYLDGDSYDITNQSSEPSASDYSVGSLWYNRQSKEFYKNVDNSGVRSWELLSSSDYEVITEGQWIYFSNSEKLYRASCNIDGAFAKQYDSEDSMIYYTENDLSTRAPSIGSLKYIMFDADSLQPEGERPLILNKAYRGLPGNQWTVSGGAYQLNAPTTYAFVSSGFEDIFNGAIKAFVLEVVEGQYYKEEDQEESKEYLVDGSDVTSITFDITSSPDFGSQTPDHTFDFSGQTVAQKTYFTFTIDQDGQEETYYIQSFVISGMSSALCFYPEEITTAEKFLEVVGSLGNFMLYQNQGGQSMWLDKVLDEKGVFDIGIDALISMPSSTQSFVNTFAYVSFQPAKIGSLSKAINGVLQPLITASEVPSLDGYKMECYLGSDDFSSSSVGDPFKYECSKYLNKDEHFYFTLDPDKDYVFELINNNPVMFAQAGLALYEAGVQNNGETIYLKFICIDNSKIYNNVCIKITEGEI